MPPQNPASVGLPPRPFLYSVDQLSVLLEVDPKIVRSKYLWYDGREVGAARKDKLRAVNIAPVNDKPEWRVTEQELIRWMKFKKIRYYERGWVK